MENDIVLPDKMHQFRITVLPPLLPALRQEFLGVGNVTNRSIEPHIKNLSFSPFYRDRHTPIKVTAHGTRLKTTVNPALALAIYIAPPFLVAVEYPV